MFTLSRDVESRGVGLRPQLSHLSGGLEIARRPWIPTDQTRPLEFDRCAVSRWFGYFAEKRNTVCERKTEFGFSSVLGKLE